MIGGSYRDSLDSHEFNKDRSIVIRGYLIHFTPAMSQNSSPPFPHRVLASPSHFALLQRLVGFMGGRQRREIT